MSISLRNLRRLRRASSRSTAISNAVKLKAVKTGNRLQLVHVADSDQLEHARRLFKEYADSLPFDLSFQNFEKELANLPGKYAAPSGCIILALDENRVAGCVAMRPIDENVCEMKRLFVRPEFNGRGIGRALVAAIIRDAITRGYYHMRLDTAPFMNSAIALYRKFGFVEIDAYCENPIEGAIFMELNLRDKV